MSEMYDWPPMRELGHAIAQLMASDAYTPFCIMWGQSLADPYQVTGELHLTAALSLHGIAPIVKIADLYGFRLELVDKDGAVMLKIFMRPPVDTIEAMFGKKKGHVEKWPNITP
ncbi:MAG: hypothetical protein V3W44_10040 [Dehalococcoidales bacterium]